MDRRIPIESLLHNSMAAPSTPPVHHFQRFDRGYYRQADWVYPFPCDENQADFWDVLHELIYQAALKNRLHVAELKSDSGLRILDVGCGTGKWCQNMAARYPDAAVIGIDLVPWKVSQPFSNMCNMTPVDFASPTWPIPLGSQGLIHLSLLSGCVRDWLQLYRTVFRYLQGGTGSIEHIEIDWRPRCLTTFPEAAQAFHAWWSNLVAATLQTDRPIWCPDYDEDSHDLGQYLEDIGFVDITQRKIRIPARPFHAVDQHSHYMFSWYRTCMGLVEPRRPNAFESLSMMSLTNEGMEEDRVNEMCKEVESTVEQADMPLYHNLYIWTARRPFPGGLMNGPSHH